MNERKSAAITMNHEYIQYRNEDLFRDKNGNLTQMTRGQIDRLRHLVSEPKITALNIQVVEITHTDENHHSVYISVKREIVAIVMFSFNNTDGEIFWQMSSKGSAYETGDCYEYIQKRILKIAREAYTKDKTLYAPRKPQAEFVAYGGRINNIVQYEVTVARNKKVVAVVQFAEGGLDGAIFWQKTTLDKAALDYLASREADIMKTAREYFVEKRPWPILDYRTTPYPAVSTRPKSLS